MKALLTRHFNQSNGHFSIMDSPAFLNLVGQNEFELLIPQGHLGRHLLLLSCLVHPFPQGPSQLGGPLTFTLSGLALPVQTPSPGSTF